MKKLFRHISFAEMKNLNLDDFSLIDIRMPEAYKDGHIEGFVNVTNNIVKDFLDQTSKEANIIVCCYHGNSSQGFSQSLCELGYKNVYSLDGGYEGWKTNCIESE
jgi:thiosulfate sulfurtransferase